MFYFISWKLPNQQWWTIEAWEAILLGWIWQKEPKAQLKVSQNQRGGQSINSASLQKSITLYSFQSKMSGCQSIRWNRSNAYLQIISSSYFLTDWNLLHRQMDTVDRWFYSCEITDREHLKSMNRLYEFNKQFSKIQRHLSKYSLME